MCPDCFEFWLTGPEERMTCTICGWEGDGREIGRKWPIDDNGPSKRELRLAGRLHFVRAWFEPSKQDEALSKVMRILKLTSAGCRGSLMIVELESRPTEEQMQAVSAVAGVVKATLY